MSEHAEALEAARKEIVKWDAYLNRLIVAGRRGTPECIAVRDNLLLACADYKEAQSKGAPPEPEVVVPTPPPPPVAAKEVQPPPPSPPKLAPIHRQCTVAGYVDACALARPGGRSSDLVPPRIGAEDAAALARWTDIYLVPRFHEPPALPPTDSSMGLLGKLGTDFTHALNSSGGYGDSESTRFCRRCGSHFKKALEDPTRCANCFAPRHSRSPIMADQADGLGSAA